MPSLSTRACCLHRNLIVASISPDGRCCYAAYFSISIQELLLVLLSGRVEGRWIGSTKVSDQSLGEGTLLWLHSRLYSVGYLPHFHRVDCSARMADAAGTSTPCTPPVCLEGTSHASPPTSAPPPSSRLDHPTRRCHWRLTSTRNTY